MEKFVIGALVGGVIGALTVSNNAKMRSIVKQGQEEIKEKVSCAVEEKLAAWQKKKEEGQSEGEEENEELLQKGVKKRKGEKKEAQEGDAEKKEKKK